MKKALALSAFALILTLPLVSSAGTMSSAFKTSSTGTSSLAVGDTIQLEVSFTSTAGFSLTAFFFSLSGDATEAVAQGPGAGPVWATVQGNVTNWSWNYRPTFGTVKFSTKGFITPAIPPGSANVPNGPVQIANGFFGVAGKSGNGTTSLLGTVTIQVNAAGSFEGGAFEVPGLDGMIGTAGADTYISNTFGYTVVPEPGTALLMVLGLGGLGVMGRKSRK